MKHRWNSMTNWWKINEMQWNSMKHRWKWCSRAKHCRNWPARWCLARAELQSTGCHVRHRRSAGPPRTRLRRRATARHHLGPMLSWVQRAACRCRSRRRRGGRRGAWLEPHQSSTGCSSSMISTSENIVELQLSSYYYCNRAQPVICLSIKRLHLFVYVSTSS